MKLGNERLIASSGNILLKEPPKRIVLSGPSGFLGSRVVRSIMQVQQYRWDHGLNPGELIVLSSSPGRLMERLAKEHGLQRMSTVRASRVDYYTQHDVDTWIDNLGSLNLQGGNCVFVNLAAVAGPDGGKGGHALVNYNAPIAAAKACEYLGFGHWVQSSTQATYAERASQVRYSRGKAMADFALSRMERLPVTIATLGLLYSRTDGIIGQDANKGINLIDLALLPLTPIMGSGTAPLQPQEVSDASDRLAYLALSDPANRPQQRLRSNGGIKVEYREGVDLPVPPMTSALTVTNVAVSKSDSTAGKNVLPPKNPSLRVYDAVGPETVTMTDLLKRFAKYQCRSSFRPVHIGYNNMEEILNIVSFGNMNRQFLSLLRSEQESHAPVTGDHRTWETLLGPNAKLITLDEAFAKRYEEQKALGIPPRKFPYWTTIKLVVFNPSIIWPGIKLSLEILNSFFQQRYHNYINNLTTVDDAVQPHVLITPRQ